MTQRGLFERESVVVGQPKRSRWHRYRGPALTVCAVEGTLLAQVTGIDDAQWLLTKTSGEVVVGIRRARTGQCGPARFHFTDAAGGEVGTAVARGLVKSRQLSLRTERGRPLFLTRRGHLADAWHLAEADPERVPASEVLGRVTVRTIDAWLGLQQYVVATDTRLGAGERRTVVASVVCLHLLRRPPGGSAAPA
ncbi:hypothetical protein J2X68_000799 [Streptomyces sp. 3330]|uniref:hypothetical protein n=1 Tax=Streptomyces sp. 3330 TaxID=2817755 RepID=UPI00285475B1|nr:hypothetical protein [Streptomyces sp. 3330]MDR6974121.1 hypothetical protein [Streptomyces sp. 3330]